MILTAKDDPLVMFNSFPTEALEENSKIDFIATERGGHLAWFEDLKGTRWYPKPVFNFINSQQAKIDNI